MVKETAALNRCKNCKNHTKKVGKSVFCLKNSHMYIVNFSLWISENIYKPIKFYQFKYTGNKILPVTYMFVQFQWTAMEWQHMLTFPNQFHLARYVSHSHKTTNQAQHQLTSKLSNTPNKQKYIMLLSTLTG